MDSQPSSNSALDDQRVPELDPTQVLELLRAKASRELDMDFVEVPTNQPLAEIGMDSVTGVAYRAAIARRLGADFPASFLYEYPTLAIRPHISFARRRRGSYTPRLGVVGCLLHRLNLTRRRRSR